MAEYCCSQLREGELTSIDREGFACVARVIRDCRKTSRYMCGRAIKPVRLQRGTTELFKVKAYRLRYLRRANGPSPQVLGRMSEQHYHGNLSFAEFYG